MTSIYPRSLQRNLSTWAVTNDDTTVPVLAPGLGRTKTGRLWAVVRDERTWAGAAPPAAFYCYSPDRRGERAEALLPPRLTVRRTSGAGAVSAAVPSSRGPASGNVARCSLRTAASGGRSTIHLAGTGNEGSFLTGGALPQREQVIIRYETSLHGIFGCRIRTSSLRKGALFPALVSAPSRPPATPPIAMLPNRAASREQQSRRQGRGSGARRCDRRHGIRRRRRRPHRELPAW
jgi:hypothetical protein